VVGAKREDLQDQKVERALQEVCFWHSVLSSFERSMTAFLSEVKGKILRPFMEP
jgi:hypothetical protein